MKKSVTYIIIFALSALAITGAMIVIHVLNAHKDFEKNITVEEGGVVTDTIEMVAYGLNPGTSKEFTVNLGCKAGMEGTYNVSLDFQQTEDSPLKEFVDVEILVNGERVITCKLQEILEENADVIAFTAELVPQKPVKIVFHYSVEESVGNEAMAKTASFNVFLTAKK